jgi:sugar phosphate isomerase/epimerase
MQFGVCTNPPDYTSCKQAGAEFVEGHVQQFLKPMDETWQPPVPRAALPLPLVAYNCFFPADLRITGPGVDLARVKAYAERACRRARDMGSAVIVFGSGGARTVPDGWPRQKAETQFVEAMQALGPIAKAAGITIAMEHLNRGESNILNSLDEGMEYIRRAAAPGISILCDLYHFTLEKEPMESLVRAGPILTHVHIAEPVGRVPPGPDMTDCRPFFRTLKRIGYDARISIECSWKDMKVELAPSLEFLRQEWKAA